MQETRAKLGLGVLATLLAMAATMAYFDPAPVSASHERDATDRRRHVEEVLARSLRLHRPELPRSEFTFAKTLCSCARDARDWAMVSVAPRDVARIRREVLRHAYRAGRTDVRRATLIRTDADLLGELAPSRPAWWTPTRLPDAEIVAIGKRSGTVCVFSEKMGTIYVATWNP